ncbi:hypothetical protein NXX56_13875 [Bacteroides thetaiotaomicron]|nr:hypothetical protein [Bacteroides thetaiotaomicron]
MNFKFRITKYLAVSALAVLLLGACSKNNIYMDVAYPNGEGNNGGEEGNSDNPDKKGCTYYFQCFRRRKKYNACHVSDGKRIAELVMCLPFQYHQYDRGRACR